jgi:hypothetical protein
MRVLATQGSPPHTPCVFSIPAALAQRFPVSGAVLNQEFGASNVGLALLSSL